MALTPTILVLLLSCNYVTVSYATNIRSPGNAWIGTDVLTTAVTPTYHMCKSLCLYTTRCVSYRRDVSGRRCHLNSELSNDTFYTRIQKTLHICGNQPCADHEVCVPVKAASEYICLLRQDNINTTVTTVNITAAAAASVTSTSTVTPTIIVSNVVTTTATAPITTMAAVTTTTMAAVTTTTMAAVTTTSMAAVTTTTTVEATTTTATYNYTGCYLDNSSRVLPYHKMTSSSLTTGKCFTHCRGNNRVYFGTENSKQCFCGDVIKNGYQKMEESECNYNCTGDVATTCGGPWRISIYKID